MDSSSNCLLVCETVHVINATFYFVLNATESINTYAEVLHLILSKLFVFTAITKCSFFVIFFQ